MDTYNCVLQEAVARGFELELARLGQPESYFESLPKELEAKRDFMAKFLTDVGMIPTIPEGGYFMIADWSPLGMSKLLIKNLNTRVGNNHGNYYGTCRMYYYY